MQRIIYYKIFVFFDSSKILTIDDQCVTLVFDIKPQCRQLEEKIGPLLLVALTSNSTDD